MEHVIIEYGVILELESIERQFPSIQSIKDWGRQYATKEAVLCCFDVLSYARGSKLGVPTAELLPKCFCIDMCTQILEKFISYVYTKYPRKNEV